MKISVVIIARNAAGKIEEAIRSAKPIADEIIVLEGRSTDNTVEIAGREGARVVRQLGKNFSEWRNQGMETAKGEWVLYLDHDEKITQELAKEIKNVISNSSFVAFAIPRLNIIFGKPMRHGGLYPDYQQRLFLKRGFKKWVNELHEEPRYEGRMSHLKNHMIHNKHDNISEMIDKTNEWSVVEAKLLLGSGHPKMSWWRFFRIMLTELWDKLIVKGELLDGTAGIIYAIYQMWSRFITYAKLWEMQNSKSK
jgi:glycosyltransferase involved in cell wall biosynthesis